MTQWQKTACSLCYVNCGLEVQTDGRKITRVRGDREHPRSEGYLCQKAQRLTWYGDHGERLTTPLRRRPDGTHEPTDWDTALTEIADRLRAIRDDDTGGDEGPMAYVGGGGQGNHSGGPYGHALLQWMRSTRLFGALSQEKTGDFWVNGKMFGHQTCHTAESVEMVALIQRLTSLARAPARATSPVDLRYTVRSASHQAGWVFRQGQGCGSRQAATRRPVTRTSGPRCASPRTPRTQGRPSRNCPSTDEVTVTGRVARDPSHRPLAGHPPLRTQHPRPADYS